MLLLLGCSVSRQADPVHGNEASTAPVSWFRPDTGTFLFTTRIELMKNHYSGITVIRSDSAGNYRVALITEIGLKLLDMSLAPDGGAPQVNYVMDALNRKMLINTLSSDLNLMLKGGHAGMKPRVKGLNREGLQVICYRNRSGKQRYYLNPENRLPARAMGSGGLGKKVTALYYGLPGQPVDSVKLDHSGFRLKIDLYRIP
jgi:hypothetical protein